MDGAGQAGCLPRKAFRQRSTACSQIRITESTWLSKTKQGREARDGSGLHGSHGPQSDGQVARAESKPLDWEVRLLCGCSFPNKRITLRTAEGRTMRPFWRPISDAEHLKWVWEAVPTSWEASSPQADLTEGLLCHRLKQTRALDFFFKHNNVICENSLR